MIAARFSIAHWFAPPTSLHSYLTRLIVGGLGPILIFSVFMMVLLARQEQATFAGIPDRIGEHAAQSTQPLGPFLLVEMEQRFVIAGNPDWAVTYLD